MTTMRERLLRLRADAVRERGGQEAEHRDERRHQHRAEALFGRALGAASSSESAVDPAEALEIGDHENRVLDGDAEDGDEAHRRGHREVHAREKQREHAARARDGMLMSTTMNVSTQFFTAP